MNLKEGRLCFLGAFRLVALRLVNGCRRRRWALLMAGALSIGYGCWIWFLPVPTAWTTAIATTERVEFSVGDRRLAAIPLSGMRFTLPPLRDELSCLDGILTPDVGAVIAYERARESELAVVLVSGAATYEPRKGAGARRIEGGFDIVVDKDCEGPMPARFPIWGALRLGDEIHPTSQSGRIQPGLLIEGRLKVQARALKGALVPWGRDAIYPVADFDLPVGSRVESSADAGRPAAWWGTAYQDPQKIALQVAASTESRAFAIYRPGSTVADTVTVTGLTQLFADPNVIRVQALAVVLLAIIQLTISLWPFSEGPRSDE